MSKREHKPKPKWPHRRTVVMTAHANGQWCKKVAGQLRYFGPWSDPDGALDRYLAKAAPLHDGQPVNTSPSGTVTVGDCFNEYLNHRRPDVTPDRRRDGRDRAFGPTMFRRYVRAGQMACDVLGRNRAADSLTPRDFAVLKGVLDDRYATTTLANYLNAIRTVLTWAFEHDVIPAPVKLGDDFRAVGLKRAIRRARRERGKKLLSAATIRALLDKASPQLKAMVLLGVNAGFLSVDCSDLHKEDVDLDRGVVTMARAKTEIDRICPLWRETTQAIRAAIEVRPEPTDSAHADRVFLTKRGRVWVVTEDMKLDGDRITSVTHNDYISQEYRKLFTKAGIARPVGCGFSWLRHTFYTIARRTKNYDAVNVIQGHAAGAMIEHYLEDVALSELREVTDSVRQWLLNE